MKPYENKEVIDYSSVNLYAELDNYNYYDVKYAYTKTKSIGTLVACKATSVKDAALRAPCWVTAGSDYDPAVVIVLSVYPTPENNLPKEVKL